jgi:hypothetical protein
MLTVVSSVDTPRERDFMDENSGLIDLKTVHEHATIMHAEFERDGGFTYSLPLFGFPETGFVVCVNNIAMEFAEPPTVMDLVAFIVKNNDLLHQTGKCAGLWHDKKKGVYLLEISTVFTHIDEALRLGQARGQTCIYDLAARKDISVAEEYDKMFATAKTEAETEKIYHLELTAPSLTLVVSALMVTGATDLANIIAAAPASTRPRGEK